LANRALTRLADRAHILPGSLNGVTRAENRGAAGEQHEGKETLRQIPPHDYLHIVRY